MTKIIPAQAYFDKKAESKQRLIDLEQEINSGKEKVIELEAKYKKMVWENDAKADDVFQEKESLKKAIKAKEARHSTFSEIMEEDLLTYAIEVMDSAQHIKHEFSEEETNAINKINDLKQQLIAAEQELQAINNQYRRELYTYSPIYDEHGMAEHDGTILGQKGQNDKTRFAHAHLNRYKVNKVFLSNSRRYLVKE